MFASWKIEENVREKKIENQSKRKEKIEGK